VPIRPSAPPALPPPPYGVVAVPAFRFRALAALAARLPLGGARETALACLLGARLAAGTLPPYALSAEQRRGRAADAQLWLSALALPAEVREAVARLLDATGAGAASPPALREALERAVDMAIPLLDDPARGELAALLHALAEASPAAAPPAAHDAHG
jgi:hypothetical protein